MTLSADMSDFTRHEMTFRGKTKPVWVSGEAGPAVLVLHEVYGITPTLLGLCRWIRGGGLRVYVPVMLGRPDARNPETITLGRTLSLCMSREFTLSVTGRPSPVTEWLRDLAHKQCGGPGVGVIGLCLTGGFGLAMAVDPVVIAPVLGEPSLPALRSAALEVSDDALATIVMRAAGSDALRIRGYRFRGDTLCRKARFETLRRKLGNAFLYREFADDDGNPAGFPLPGQAAAFGVYRRSGGHAGRANPNGGR